jgi:hypothetical protein
MIKLRIAKRKLRATIWTVLIAGVVAGLYGLGVKVTPLDAAGEPMILSPSRRATEAYRRRVTGWVSRMAGIDGQLTGLLGAQVSGADPTELYAQGESMQAVGEEATGVAYEVEGHRVSVALVAVRDQTLAAARAYVDAAVATARWLSAPTEAGRRQGLALLRAARAQRVRIEESGWLLE